MAHRGRAGVWFVCILCAALCRGGGSRDAEVGLVREALCKGRRAPAIIAARSAVTTPEAKLARRIADKDAAAVMELQKLLSPAADKAASAPKPKLSEEEATELVSALSDLRKGCSNANPAGKSVIVGCLGKMIRPASPPNPRPRGRRA